ncbi:unnamed protein product [Lactuca saligna]|uniref:SWIM-type domain-containing protein n=1 Tax=Lactuca saligna TaxID=75948 RepID=A0AA35UQF8_LACSI|nr:unnamed protein product [Lactuca saligna]
MGGGPTSGKKVKGKDVNSDKVKCTWKLHASRSSEQDYWLLRPIIRNTSASKHEKSDLAQQHFFPNVLWIRLKLILDCLFVPYKSNSNQLMETCGFIPNQAIQKDIRVFRSFEERFKAGLREFLGLDGAFMKGPFPGQILSAVGVDSNNEPTHWHMLLLKVKTLQVGNGSSTAIEQLFPNAEHRFCIRHIYQNMRKLFKTTEYKEYFWRCATATTIPEFEAVVMVELRNYDIEAYQWLLKIPPHHWYEVIFQVLNKCQGPLTPTGTRILEANTTLASKYHARWNGGQKYQVKGPWNDQHVVDMEKRECSCRKWELTGIPCKHAIASLNEMADNNEKVGELYTYVHKVYWLDTWKEMYSFKVEPIKGRAMWPKSDCPTTLVPPPHNKAIGRPKKKRRIQQRKGLKSSNVRGKQTVKVKHDNETQSLSRKFLTVTCSKCKQKGHNARTCKAKMGNEC